MCPSNLPSTRSFRHRILINLRSPRVVPITVSVSVHLTEKDIFYKCHFVYLNYPGMLTDCTPSLLNIIKQLPNLKSGHAKLVRRYCKFGNFREGYFRETSQMRSFLKIKSSRIGEITLSFSDIGKSRPCREFSMSQICVLTLFAKIKFSRKFPNLQLLLL